MRKILLLSAGLILLAQTVTSENNQERHLKNIRQLTFGGENAEAYFASDGRHLIFQSTREPFACDQIFTMSINGEPMRLVSTGKGRCTCGFYSPDGKKIIFASTHLGDDSCPPPPDYSKGYVWALYKTYDIFIANAYGSSLKRLTDSYGYDAECVFSPDGKKILFTSDRDGDLELYEMDVEGKNLKRLTNSPGYDGGGFYSLDGKKICFRARVISDSAELKDFQENLKEGLVRPSKLEIFVMNADGTERKQITNNGAANFCPYFTPDGKRIIFSSNMDDPDKSGRNFELYLINVNGTGLERITHNPTFDGFPMFSNDGKRLVFCSNRNNQETNETNVFVAEWRD